MLTRRTAAGLLTLGLAGCGMSWLGAQPAAISANKLGVNVGGVEYYTNDFPFLNEMKNASGNGAGNLGRGFMTVTNGDTQHSTFEEGYVTWDVDGYPTSLTASPTPPSGQAFAAVGMLLYVNNTKPSGASSNYPTGQRTVLFDGAGTLSITGDATATITTSGSTFTPTPSATGLTIRITQTDPSATGNYLRNLRIVRTSLLSNLNSGQIFTPEYLAALQSGFHSLRFMDLLRTNSEWTGQSLGYQFLTYTSATITAGSTSATLGTPVTFTSGPGSGATSATIQNLAGGAGNTIWPYASNSSMQMTFSNGDTRTVTLTGGATTVTWTGGLSSNCTAAANVQVPWNFPTQTVTVLFRQGDVRQVQFTQGSPSISWTGGLSLDCVFNANSDPMLNISWKNFTAGSNGWGARSLMSNVNWITLKGLPWEVAIALCQASAAGGWFNIPLAYSDSDVTSLLQLIESTLTNTAPVYLELSNEVWNGSFRQNAAAGFYGKGMWPNQGGATLNTWMQNWYGMRCAQIAQLAKNNMTTFGRCYPVISAQTANTSTGTAVLNTTYWAQGPAYNYPLKAFAITFYWGGAPSAADITTMVGQGDGGFTDFFATLYSNVAPGGTYSSINVNGWFGQATGFITNYANLLNASFPKLGLVGYESGFNFTGNNNSGVTGATDTAWKALIAGTTSDSRILTAVRYMTNYWLENVGAGNLINYYAAGFQADGNGGNWYCAQSVLQTLSPPSSAPFKWQGLMNYLGRYG